MKGVYNDTDEKTATFWFMEILKYWFMQPLDLLFNLAQW